jgi:hypothetical protein
MVAAALLAVNFLHMRNSHFGTNDVCRSSSGCRVPLLRQGYREPAARLPAVRSPVRRGHRGVNAGNPLPLFLGHVMRLHRARGGLWRAHAALVAAVACAVLVSRHDTLRCARLRHLPARDAGAENEDANGAAPP